MHRVTVVVFSVVLVLGLALAMWPALGMASRAQGGTGAVSTTHTISANGPGVVILDMDDLQAWWLRDTAVAVVQVNIEENVDLFLNVIPWQIGYDSVLVPKLQEWNTTKQGLIEIGEHGYEHECNLDQLSYADQRTIVEEGLAELNAIGIDPKSFTPGCGNQNEDTLRVLADLGFHTDLDCWEGLSSTPKILVLRQCACELSDEYGVAGPDVRFQSSSTLMANMDSTIGSYGYAIVAFHMQDFSTKSGDLDNVKLDQYRQILEDLKNSGKYRFMTVEEYYQLTALSAPSVTTQPSNQTVTVGGTATFTAAASGNPAPTVQWQVSTDGGSTWGNIAGATRTTLTLTSVTLGEGGYKYRAVFTNIAGAATSNAATLTVQPLSAPSVTTQPSNQTVTVGGTATFTAAASGNPAPTVQWQASTDGGSTWGNIAGATSTTLTLPSVTLGQSGYKYHAVFTNIAGAATSNAATLTVQPAPTGLTITTTSLPNGEVSVAYSQTMTATGGTPPYTWSLSGRSLPAGLTASASGVISGTPTTAGTFRFTIRVTDSAGGTATRALSITVRAALTIATTSLPNGRVGVAYRRTLTATGGTPPYTWSLSGGSLPAGLTPSASGVISGTPTTAGTFRFTIRVTDSIGGTATKALSITVR